MYYLQYSIYQYTAICPTISDYTWTVALVKWAAWFQISSTGKFGHQLLGAQNIIGRQANNSFVGSKSLTTPQNSHLSKKLTRLEAESTFRLRKLHSHFPKALWAPGSSKPTFFFKLFFPWLVLSFLLKCLLTPSFCSHFSVVMTCNIFRDLQPFCLHICLRVDQESERPVSVFFFGSFLFWQNTSSLFPGKIVDAVRIAHHSFGCIKDAPTTPNVLSLTVKNLIFDVIDFAVLLEPPMLASM